MSETFSLFVAWQHLYECEEGPDRDQFADLLNRNFKACGDPRGWDGFSEATPELQEFLIASHLRWAGF